jgi:protein O-mannosyl-transferase
MSQPSILPRAPDGVLPEQIRKCVPYYVLALVVLCFYGNVYDNALLYDDEFLILRNEYLRSLHWLWHIFSSSLFSGALEPNQFYRPLQNVLYLIVYQIAGLSLFGFHFLNVVLHIANACLVYVVGCRLRFNACAVFIAALLWALHPVHTEAVTFISGAADPLYAFFCLSGLVVLLPDFKARRFPTAAAFFVLGLLSKETAIVFPMLVMSSMYLMQPDRFAPRTYLRTWPLWLVVFLYLGLRLVVVPLKGGTFLDSAPASEMYATHIVVRVYTFLATIPAYLGLLIWPVGLHMERNFPVYTDPWHWQVIVGAILVATAAAQVLWGSSRKRGLPLSWGLMWFACAQLPQTGILTPVNSLFYEHWMYLPTVGLLLGVAQTISVTLENTRVRISAAVGGCFVALILGGMTYRQNEVWYDPVTFYTNILSYGETSARVHDDLGAAYIKRGDYDLAMEQFQLALERSDTLASVHENMAVIYFYRSKVQEEIAELKRALEIDPDYVNACDALARAYDLLGDKQNADLYREKAADIRNTFGL